MSEQSENITQFMAITGVSEDRARFYLDSAAGQLEVAIARYYENEEEESDPVEMVEEQPPPPADKDSGATGGESAFRQVKKKPTPKPPTKFATLNTLNVSSDEDEEEGQAYYAGGSEHSGQQVLGPPKRKDIVADMFKSVKEHGVEIVEPHSSGSSQRPFRGTGYLLGQDNNDSEVIPGVEEPPAPMEVTLRLWQNGFSVNDGELRSYTDPENKDFLESIRRGQIPQELMQGTSEIHLAMEDHRKEAYKPSGKKKGVKAFQGQGYTLGSPAPTVVSTSSTEDNTANESKAKEAVNVDTTKPTTSLQIRLADGSRLVGQFNHDHTIENVRAFIETARPQYRALNFNLLTSYPSKVLENSETLQGAGILNAAIMQKLT